MSAAVTQTDRRLKPIAGFPSQVAACAALADAGRSPEEIAEELGRDTNYVRATLRRWRTPERPRTVAVPRRVAAALDDEAAARGLTRNELVAQLLEVIARDELFEPLLGEPGAVDG